MTQNFFLRLRKYFENVGEVLRGEAKSASIFPNTSDIGTSRELVYVEFLKHHAPSKCNVFLGGFLFDMKGIESRQLDVIVTTDTTPRFNLHNKDGSGKSFSPVEGTLGVASIKSTLNKNELEDALLGIASIPPTESLDNRISFTVKLSGYDDWPFKIIYATAGIAGTTLIQHLNDFYNANPNIPVTRRPNLIHVAGKYIIIRDIKGFLLSTGREGEMPIVPELNLYYLITSSPDLLGILWVLDSLQKNALASTVIRYTYSELINKVLLLPKDSE